MSSNLHETAGRCILSTVLWYYNVLQYSAQGTTPSSSMYISAYKTAEPLKLFGPSYCFRGHVNMCNIVDENTSTVLSTLSGIHSCQFHAIILYNLPKNDCF